MDLQVQTATTRTTLALAGGMALGAYAAGAYEVIERSGRVPSLISGASVGAILAALIAGNPAPVRLDRIREFWHQAAFGGFSAFDRQVWLRQSFNAMNAMQTIGIGRPGIFRPRLTGFLSLLPWTPPADSLFDPAPIVATLERLIDFDLLNRATLPIVVTCLDVESGEIVCFDSRLQQITPRHLLASTAFIPGFAPVEIDGRWLGDAGLCCNLPLEPLLAEPVPGHHQCFAVDLFDARGPRPRSIDGGLERAQDLMFAGQSLQAIRAYQREFQLRHRLSALQASFGREPADPLQRQPVDALDLVLIAYRPEAHELGLKTIDFSQASIDERWRRGIDDMTAALGRADAVQASERDDGFALHDCRRHVPSTPT